MQQSKKPKILVGCPVSDYHEYCTEEFIQSIKSFTYQNYDVLLVDNSESDRFYNSIKDKVNVEKIPYSKSVYERLINSRNKLRERALEGGYDYLFSIEQDVIAPKNIIQKLLEHKKDIISGVYFIPEMRGDKPRLAPMIWAEHPTDPMKKTNIKDEVIAGKYLIKIAACGLGCLLISRKVLEKIKFRYDLKQGTGVDDSFFSFDAAKTGFEMYADTATKCKHLINGRKWYWKDLVKQV